MLISLDLVELTKDLIALRSLPGEEFAALEYLANVFQKFDWPFERMVVDGERFNIWVPFGTPKVVFTTHIDVVPAPDRSFVPRVEGDTLFGRGACDAKGVLSAMIGACLDLRARGAHDFALLVVVGEETDGIGAKVAGERLQGRGIQYLVNGEPTEGKIVVAHRGAISFTVSTTGKACHSGYPELGVDANAALLEISHRILHADFGSDPKLGRATVNIGVLNGGLATNVVSPHALLDATIRTVTKSEQVLERIQSCIPRSAKFNPYSITEPTTLLDVPGFEKTVVSFTTDIPNFAALNAEAVLYGPGTIHVAHTDDEHVTVRDLFDARQGYGKIFEYLQVRPS